MVESKPYDMYDGSREWRRNRVLHRFNGPAVEFASGPVKKRTEWYINGKRIDGEKYQDWLVNNGMSLNNLTQEDKELILLIWGA